LYFSSSTNRVVVLCTADRKKTLCEAIAAGAPHSSVHAAETEQDAWNLLAKLHESGSLPDVVFVDLLSSDLKPLKLIEFLRQWCQNSCPVVAVFNESVSDIGRVPANSHVDDSPESIAAAARYWTKVNLAKPSASISPS
jgi:CheY-like chemotaxis protein